MGKVMRHTLGASLNIRHNLSSSKGPKPLQLKLLTTYIPKTSALDRKSGSAGMPRPISYAVFCLKKKKTQKTGNTTLVFNHASKRERQPVNTALLARTKTIATQ